MNPVQPSAANTFSASNSATSNNGQPCWLEQPMWDGQGGQIGIARTISGTSQTPEEISRLRALRRLCASQGVMCDDEQLDAALAAKNLLGKPVHFAEYQQQGYLYSYAGFVPASDKQCAAVPCNINQCKPSWICSPSSSDQGGLVGVSYRSISPERQYQYASDNAFLQAEYLYGIRVQADKSLQRASLNTGEYRNLSERSSVDVGARETIPYYIQSQCFSNGTLFSHMVIETDVDRAVLEDNNLEWLQNPKFGGIDGAVGGVERMTASGLISDQIELAIRRAAVQLAFEKFSKVSEKSLYIQRSGGGRIQISHINEQTDVELKAQVLKIHFVQSNEDVLKVYAWVHLVE